MSMDYDNESARCRWMNDALLGTGMWSPLGCHDVIFLLTRFRRRDDKSIGTAVLTASMPAGLAVAWCDCHRSMLADTIFDERRVRTCSGHCASPYIGFTSRMRFDWQG